MQVTDDIPLDRSGHDQPYRNVQHQTAEHMKKENNSATMLNLNMADHNPM